MLQLDWVDSKLVLVTRIGLDQNHRLMDLDWIGLCQTKFYHTLEMLYQVEQGAKHSVAFTSEATLGRKGGKLLEYTLK